MAFLCVSQQGEFKNTTKKLLGKRRFPLSFFPLRFCFVVFLAVSRFSAQGTQKRHTKKGI
jgi:hypothetical protein